MNVGGAHISGRIRPLANEAPLIKLIVLLVICFGASSTAATPASGTLVQCGVLICAGEAHLGGNGSHGVGPEMLEEVADGWEACAYHAEFRFPDRPDSDFDIFP